MNNRIINNEETLRVDILENGIQSTLKFLTSPNFPEDAKSSLSAQYFFVGGYPNLERIMSIS